MHGCISLPLVCRLLILLNMLTCKINILTCYLVMFTCQINMLHCNLWLHVNITKLLVDINTCMFHVNKGQRYATIVLFVEDTPCFVIYALKLIMK